MVVLPRSRRRADVAGDAGAAAPLPGVALTRAPLFVGASLDSHVLRVEASN